LLDALAVQMVVNDRLRKDKRELQQRMRRRRAKREKQDLSFSFPLSLTLSVSPFLMCSSPLWENPLPVPGFTSSFGSLFNYSLHALKVRDGQG
jgi:hypothetical protein